MFEKYKNDQEFYSLVGIKPQTFQKMVEILKVAQTQREICGGRKNKVSIENRLLMTLEYWKQYIPYSNLSHKYQINRSTCMQNIIWVESILIKFPEFHIPGKDEIIKNNPNIFIVDATETPIERIKKNRKNIILERKKPTQ